jgi:hypothetical protein
MTQVSRASSLALLSGRRRHDGRVCANTNCVFTPGMLAHCAPQQQVPLHRRMATRTKRRAFAPAAAGLHELRQNA